MPRTWHDRHAANKIEDESERSFYRSIVADKKPYFMKYIYPDLMKQYNTYIKNTDKNSLREFGLTVKELMNVPGDQRTDRQNEFLKYYNIKMPVGSGECVMNKICKRFEEEFDSYVHDAKAGAEFDYSIMTSDAKYGVHQLNAIKKVYDEFRKRVASFEMFADRERLDASDSQEELRIMGEEFKKECDNICSNNSILCNIILDVCYKKNATKRFAWWMCGDSIIENLLSKNKRIISFPIKDSTGDISYCGNNFSVVSVEVNDDNIA